MANRFRMTLPEKIFVSMAGVLLTAGVVGVVAAMASRNQLRAEEVKVAQRSAPNPNAAEPQPAPSPLPSQNPTPLAVPEPAVSPSEQVHQEPVGPETTTTSPSGSPQGQLPPAAVGVETTASQPSSAIAVGNPPTPDARTQALVLQRVEPTPPRGLNRNQLPPALRDSEIKVAVKVFVGYQGKPLKVLVENGVPGASGYDDAAKQAALQSTYAPGTRGGRPINSWISVEYNFGKPK